VYIKSCNIKYDYVSLYLGILGISVSGAMAWWLHVGLECTLCRTKLLHGLITVFRQANHLVIALTELRFNVPLDTKYIILEILFPASLVASTEV